MAFYSETAKGRERVRGLCMGKGLDLGCGGEKICPDAIGVDARIIPSVDMALDLTGSLPFEDGEFDYVFSSHCLEHLVPPPGQLLPLWRRVIAPGGYLILYLPHKDLYKVPNPEHFHEFEPGDVTSVIKALGGVVVHNQTESGADQFYSFLIVARKPR